jgi:hypothetical protein
VAPRDPRELLLIWKIGNIKLQKKQGLCRKTEFVNNVYLYGHQISAVFSKFLPKQKSGATFFE